MNALLLLLITLLVFAMGYRFYAKFLALGVFGLDRAAPVDAEPGNTRWVMLGYNTAATVGLISVAGVGVGVVWGWVPAFLWIVAGTLVAGGVYALAAVWAGLHRPGDSFAGMVFDLAGAWGALPIFAMGVTLVLSLCAGLSLLLGQLLDAHPEVVWSFLCLLGVSGLLRRCARARGWRHCLLWSGAALAIWLGAILLGQALPVSLYGEWRFDIGGADMLTVPQGLVWSGVGLWLAHRCVREPLSKHAQPLGVALGTGLILVMVAAVVGLVSVSPTVVAPQFRPDAGLPGPLPVLFLVVTGGALSGVAALIAARTTLPQLRRPKDAEAVGYGSAMVDGGLAVLVLAALCAGFADADDWLAVYAGWPEQAALYVWLDLSATKLSQFVAAAGPPLSLAAGIVAGVLAGLALIMLDGALRALSYAVRELAEDFDITRLKGESTGHRVSLAAVAVSMVCLAQTDVGLPHWLLFGLANQLFAGVMLTAFGLQLAQLGRISLFVVLPAVFILGAALWGWAWLLLEWWRQGSWGFFATACLLGILALTSLAACTAAFRAIRRERGNTVKETPSL